MLARSNYVPEMTGVGWLGAASRQWATHRCHFPCVLYLTLFCTGPTSHEAEPICRHIDSNDAIWLKDVSFAGRNITKFRLGVQSPRNPLFLALYAKFSSQINDTSNRFFLLILIDIKMKSFNRPPMKIWIKESNSDVILGLEHLLAAEINIPPLLTV